jgi:hypothetical protein
MQLVHVVASLPTTILEVVRSPGQSGASPQMIRAIVDGYVGLYYYSALANVLAQSLLPAEEVFDSKDQLHLGVSALIDRTAADFQHMATVLNGLDQTLVANSSLTRLLEEALNQWRPHVKFYFASFRGPSCPGFSPCRLTPRSTRTSRLRGFARAAGRRLPWFVRVHRENRQGVKE